MSPRRKYDAAFKRNVVELSDQRENISDLAQELGLTAKQIYKWRSDYKANPQASFPGNGNPKQTPEQARIAQLEKQLAEANMEKEILKKAITIFSRNGGKSSAS